MTQTSRIPTQRIALLAAALTVGALIVLLAGCGSDDKKPPAGGGTTPTSTTFAGVFTNGTESGKLTVVVNSTSLAARFRPAMSLDPWQAGTAVITASATLKFGGGATETVTGTYDSTTDSLVLSNGDYTFHGEYDDVADPPSIAGYYTGPNGDGTFGALNAGTTPIQIYLGTFQSDSTNVTGTFNVAVYDTLAGAIAAPAGSQLGEASFLDGTCKGAGSTKGIELVGGEVGVSEVTATGTLNTLNNTVSGVWHFYDYGQPKGDDGTWSGALVP